MMKKKHFDKNAFICNLKKLQGAEPDPELTLLTSLPIILLILVTNFAVFLAVAKEKRLQVLRTVFVISLAVADFLVGAVSLPTNVVSAYMPRNRNLCLIFTLTVLFFMAASIINLIAVSIERWIAIFKPLRYRNMVTTRTVSVSLAVVWTGSFLFSIGAVHLRKQKCEGHCKFHRMIKHEYVIFMCLSFILLCFIMGYMQWKVYSVVREHRRRVCPVDATQFNVNMSRRRRLSHIQRLRRSGIAAAKDFKMTVAVNTVYLAFVFTWSPQVLILLLDATGNCKACGTSFVIFGGLAALNSAMNPLIYAMRMKEFRRPIKRLFSLICCCKTSNDTISETNGSKYTSTLRRDSTMAYPFAIHREGYLTARFREGSISSISSFGPVSDMSFHDYRYRRKSSNDQIMLQKLNSLSPESDALPNAVMENSPEMVNHRRKTYTAKDKPLPPVNHTEAGGQELSSDDSEETGNIPTIIVHSCVQ